jgi:chromosomal replication initiator protein
VRTRTAQEVWDTALGELQLQVSKANYRTWLQNSKGLSYQNNRLILGVPNTFVAEYLDKNLRSLIEKTLIGITQSDVQVNFVVDNCGQVPSAETGENAVPCPPAVIALNPGRLNPNYTFENFVVSNTNRLAFAAASGAADKPGLNRYNPLYIYGGVGLGKTHLLNALGNTALRRGKRVIYTSAEQFTNDFIAALRERRMDDFRFKFRSAEMLLIDDIQFISGKDQTEESFFHIFNELRDSERQIALTSNCPPSHIPAIEDRLRSRLEWGLSVGIQNPDFETRLAILQNKALKEGVELKPDVLEFIAQKIKQNIRELEGSLNRVVAYAKLLRSVVTPELASQALEDIADKQPRALPAPSFIVETVSHFFNLTASELKSTRRDKQTVLARQVAMYLLREETDFSLSRIGQELGGRQPIVVSQAHKKVSDLLEKDAAVKAKIEDIQQRLSYK